MWCIFRVSIIYKRYIHTHLFYSSIWKYTRNSERLEYLLPQVFPPFVCTDARNGCFLHRSGVMMFRQSSIIITALYSIKQYKGLNKTYKMEAYTRINVVIYLRLAALRANAYWTFYASHFMPVTQPKIYRCLCKNKKRIFRFYYS